MTKKKLNITIIFTVLCIIVFLVIVFWPNKAKVDFIINVDNINFNIESKIIPITDNTAFNLDSTYFEYQEYYGKVEQETIKIGVTDEVYNNYIGIGDVEHTVSMAPVKVASYNGIISFRYVNPVSNSFDSMDMALDFRNELERSGYKVVLDGENKKVYEGIQYRVVLLKEFNYLIVVIMEKELQYG